jgi:hypothetical protein
MAMVMRAGGTSQSAKFSPARDFRAARLLSRRIEPAASPGYPDLTIFLPPPGMDCLTNPEPNRGELVSPLVVAWVLRAGLCDASRFKSKAGTAGTELGTHPCEAVASVARPWPGWV